MLEYNTTKKKTNYLLYTLKGIACMGVIFIHFHFPEPYGNYVIDFFIWAVPLFFMVAGFFAFGEDKSTIKRRLLKIVRYFVVSLLLYFISNFILHYINHNLYEWFANIFSLKAMIKLFIFSTIDYAVPLWYLIVMLQIYVLWYYVVRNKAENKLISLLPAVFILQIIWVSYIKTNNLSWYYRENFIMSGLSWFLFGYYVHLYKSEITKIPNLIWCLSWILGFIIAISHDIWNIRIDFSYIGDILCSIPVFIMGIKYPYIKSLKPLMYIGEKLSLNIYVLHFLIGNLVLLGAYTLLKENIWVTYCIPLTVVVVTVIISFITVKIYEIYKCMLTTK